ncbi:50S ribosomal protein L27 [candidate division WWE3 bacterium]|nr:50S ribosomal protein L27 [candidate division WWE3 bacterium]
MAHKTSAGAKARQGGNVKGKRRGIKLSDGSFAKPGQIIVRQVGKRYHPGKNVGMGRDFTLYSKIAGIVKFKNKTKNKKMIEVVEPAAS